MYPTQTNLSLVLLFIAYANNQIILVKITLNPCEKRRSLLSTIRLIIMSTLRSVSSSTDVEYCKSASNSNSSRRLSHDEYSYCSSLLGRDEPVDTAYGCKLAMRCTQDSIQERRALLRREKHPGPQQIQSRPFVETRPGYIVIRNEIPNSLGWTMSGSARLLPIFTPNQ